MKKYQYSNTEQDDVWTELNNQAKKDGKLPTSNNKELSIKLIMDTWANQAGYPVVKIERIPETKSIRVTQERFLLSALETDKTSKWFIPFQIKLKNKNQPSDFYWMSPNSQESK